MQFLSVSLLRLLPWKAPVSFVNIYTNSATAEAPPTLVNIYIKSAIAEGTVELLSLLSTSILHVGRVKHLWASVNIHVTRAAENTAKSPSLSTLQEQLRKLCASYLTIHVTRTAERTTELPPTYTYCEWAVETHLTFRKPPYYQRPLQNTVDFPLISIL